MATPIIARANIKAVDYAVSQKGQRNSVVDIYNSYVPHPRGYIVKYEDQLCATFVSSIFIALQWTSIVPPECGARQLYRNMEALGRAELDKKRVPNVGDLIFFGNSAKASGIEHVGIVQDVQNKKQIYYYDLTGVVGRHTCPVGYSWIMGYAWPDYESKEGTPVPGDDTSSAPGGAPSPQGEDIGAGDLVHIREGARWYSGSTIKASVMTKNWYVIQNKNGRVVLGMDESQRSNIQSPIHEEDLILVRKALGDEIDPVIPEPTPVPEVPDTAKVSFTASVKPETLVKLEAMAKEKGVDIGGLLDGMVA